MPDLSSADLSNALWAVIDITNRVVKLQSGYIYHYAFVMLVGVAIIITYFIFASGGLKP